MDSIAVLGAVILFSFIQCHVKCLAMGSGDARLKIFEEGLIAVGDIKHTGNDFIHVAHTLTNIAGKPALVEQKNITVDFQMRGNKSKLMAQFERMLQSIFVSSEGYPLHFIFITDKESAPIIQNVIANEIGKYLSESVFSLVPLIPGFEHFFKFPKLRVEFVDILSITTPHQNEIIQLRQHYGHHMPKGFVFKPEGEEGPVIYPTYKYILDLFYMLPFYHKVFPTSLKKLIFLDTDLILRSDLYILYKHFSQFSSSNIFGVANDQSPHYFLKAKSYRDKNPDSPVGSPGKYQGFNTGVALLNLEKMRESEVYTNSLDIETMIGLEKKYNIRGTVGDQDWLTLLSWESPDLFYLLPCEFNIQTDKLYREKEDEEWEKFTKCNNSAKIIHNNGEGSN